MGYSENPAHVRVDFFKESGKWYKTECVEWTGAYWIDLWAENTLMHDAFAQSLSDHFGDRHRLKGMWAVCIHPYHEYSYPIMLKVE